MVKFCTNAVLARIQYINNETIDTTRSSTSVLGNGVHHGLKVFNGGDDSHPIMVNDTDSQRLKMALDATLMYLRDIPDGFIDWKASCDNRARLEELALRAVPGYIREWDRTGVKETLFVEQKLEHTVRVTHGGQEIVLPVPLQGYVDYVYEDMSGRICIVDHKTTFKYSDPDAVDGPKLIQAAVYFLLVAAETGRTPYSMTFREYKISENKDGSAQTREYVIVYEEMQIVFDLFFRLYADITRALLGEMVYLPNILAMFDRDVALLAYIYRLDEPEALERDMKRSHAASVAELMQKKMTRTKSLKKFMEAKASLFTTNVSLNYETMSIHDKIKYKLYEHGIPLDFADHVEGLSVELYRFRPTIGVKMTTIEKYRKDIEQILASSGVRILAPIPGTDLVGFEVPKKKRSFVDLADIRKKATLELPVGIDVYGTRIDIDIREMPHLLVAGTTGSGKSSFLNSTLSYFSKLPKNEMRFALVDPKRVELAGFADDPHTDAYCEEPAEILTMLTGYVEEMDARYAKLKKAKVRSIAEYREKVGKDMPYVLIVIDEFGELTIGGHVKEDQIAAGEFVSGPRKGETKFRTERIDISAGIKQCIIKLASKARAAGIHMVIATQRPSAKVVDGLIKANFPTRIAFRTVSKVDSEIILDRAGAELLQGKGDMLFSGVGFDTIRLQGFRV